MLSGLQSKLEQAAAQATVNYAHEQLQYRFGFCEKIDKATNIIGTVVVVVIWIAAFTSIGITSFPLAIYLFIIGIPITMLECHGLISKLPFCKGEGMCCTIWKVTLLLDTWKRAIPYIILGIICFFIGITTIFGPITGLLLIALGGLYIVRTFMYTGKGGFSNIPPGPGGAPPGGPVTQQPGQPGAMQDPSGGYGGPGGGGGAYGGAGGGGGAYGGAGGGGGGYGGAGMDYNKYPQYP